MADLKQLKNESLATINAALAIINNLPELDENNASLSIDTSSNPFPYLMEIFKQTTGFDILIKILSSYIATGLPALELAAKGVLLTNIKNLLTCSLNPYITDEILMDGIIFSIDQIDITDTLRYSPLDTKRGGKFYYFGCDDCQSADDVRDTAYYTTQTISNPLIDIFYGTKDMNALIWFMRNRAARREVWGKKMARDEMLDYDPNDEKSQLTKKHGIVTFEYGSHVQTLRNAEGYAMSTQTPGYDLLHVFIGNTQEEENATIKKYEKIISNTNKNLVELKDLKQQLLDKIQTQKEAISDIESKLINATNVKIENDNFIFPQNLIEKDLINKYNGNIILLNKLLNNDANKITDTDEAEKIIEKVKTNINLIKKFFEDNVNVLFYEGDIDKIVSVNYMIQKVSELKANAQTKYSSEINQIKYRPIEKNYYYRKTLIEFNYDFVMSLKLFDEKVVAAQLIDQLCGLVSINFELSFKQVVMREEIKKMVMAIVQTDDTVVNDCFFSFSNADYDAMLNKAELQKAGLFTINGEQNTNTKINSNTLLNQLNGLSENASKETIQTIIEGALTTISGEVSTYEDSEQTNFGVQMNFIENLMNNLTYVIVGSILSPKVYLLILINLQLLGQNSDFDLNTFIANFKGLIINMIREIRDELIGYLVQELMKILGNIAKDVTLKISVEQAYYNARLIKQLIACLKGSKGENLDFNIDEAVVDIYDTENEPTSSEC